MNKLSALTQALSSGYQVAKGSWDSIFLRNIPYDLDQGATKDPYKKSDIVYVCISTTARAISQVPLIVEQWKGENTWEAVPSNHPWQARLDRPNYLTDKYTFMEGVIGHLLLNGNVWSLPFPPGYNGVPDSIWTIKQTNIEKRTDKTTGNLIGWQYKPSSSTSIPLGFNEVAHVKLWNPDDSIMGQSPLEAGAISIQSHYKAAKYNEYFFDNGAVPGGVLSTDQILRDKQFERAKQQFESRHQGFSKAHRVAVLEQNLKYTQAGLSQADMQFLDLQKYSRETILQIYGMKKAIISVTDDLNHATERGQRKQWWQSTLLPIMRLVTSAFNFIFFQQISNLRIRFDTSKVEALQEDYNQKVGTGKQLFDMGVPFNAINDKLELGFDDFAWADMGYLPAGLIPATMAGQNQAQQASSTPPKKSSYEVAQAATWDTLWIDTNYNTVDTVDTVDTDSPYIEVVKNNLDDYIQKVWDSVMAVTEPIEARFESKIKRLFFDMRKQSLGLLYKKSVEDLEGASFGKAATQMSEYAYPFYIDALNAGSESLAGELGIVINLNLNDPRVQEELWNWSIKIRGTVGTVRRQINAVLQGGSESGLSIDQIADSIKQVFNVASSRARTIARTEIVGASNFARSYQIEQTSFQEKQWFTAMDERVREDHRQMHDKKTKVGAMWILPSGASLRYPGDWRGPAKAIINCRCIEVVVKEL